MTDKLQTYVDDLANAAAEKERNHAQLTLASSIQSNSLPHEFPDAAEYTLHASMSPALDVGGDFYDYIPVDDTHIALVIGDVSGKGVPASLLMMITLTVLNMHLREGRSPEEAMASVNNLLCARDYGSMFVTVWLGLIDLTTGHVTAVNAGHEFPALRRCGGGFELLKDRHSAPVGTMPGLRFRPYELQLQPGDTLFVYTDGVPEATNAREQLFGEERMLQALNQAPDPRPEALLATVRQAVDEFVGDAPQFDDLTMLAFRYQGRPDGKEE